MQAGFLANENKPVFKSHDRYGNRIDLVRVSPGLPRADAHSRSSTACRRCPGPTRVPAPMSPAPGSPTCIARPKPASGCPLTMTFAAVPAIRLQPERGRAVAAEDPGHPSTTRRNLPMEQKDRRDHRHGHDREAGRHRRARQHHPRLPDRPWRAGQGYELVGHKWFCSAPMCDAFLTLAYTDKGLSCFLLPRHRPDGTRNAFYIQRLKNKLGNWANASSEVEYRGAFAWMLGEEGRGVPTIIEMVAMTRFDCMVGSSSLMRQALTQAAHHCAHRQVGGKRLGRPAADAERAGRPGAGERSRAGIVHAHGRRAGSRA